MRLNVEKNGSGHRSRWRFRLVVAIILVLGTVFVGLGFILIMDPQWAYQVSDASKVIKSLGSIHFK